MADEPATKPKEQAKLMEQKEGKGSDDSPTELSSPFKSMEEKGENRSGDSTAKLAGPSKMSELRHIEPERRRSFLKIDKLRNQELDLQRRRSSLESEEKGGKRSDDTTAKLISELLDQELDLHRQRILKESKRIKKVLLQTQRLILLDEISETPYELRSKAKRTGLDTVMKGDAGLELHVIEWMSTEDEAHLVLRDDHSLQDVISILAPLCPEGMHFSIDFRMIRLLPLTPMPVPMPVPMRSVITVCIKSLYCLGKLQETLSEVGNLFPNAESLDMQIGSLSSPSDQAYSHEVYSSSSLRELKLRFERGRYDITTDSLLMDISTSCPNIVSLVLSGFERCLSNKSGKEITSFKMPHLTNIQLEPFGTDDRYSFETLMNVLHVVHVISPHWRFVEAKKVQLGDAELTSVKWSRTSSGCELQLEGASAAVPMADLMHLVSNELKGVTVLTFDRCKVDIPQSIGHPPQSAGEESSLRELKFSNVECPLSQTDIHKLSEMFPNVKVTVEPESQASQEDSKQGAGMPFKPERKTSPSSSPSPTSSIDELVGATARAQVHEEQTDTQNTEEEGKEEEEEDHIVMESLTHETDEVNVKPIKMECCKRVGVEGGKLQLDSFGIELEIPPGAIDSEAPQDISLRVLTDTPNLGNSKEEMSVCFGVQCLAPDDLVLKLPVTYIIPHCAVITRYSSVEAVLYTGEGEYSPDAVVKERIMLSRSGIPSCTIRKDVLQLKMNHFSWAKIKLRVNNFFFRGKIMCCWPFREKNLSLEKIPVILQAHLYDDIEGNSELVRSQEMEYEFIPARPEQQVKIKAAEVDLEMTCYVKETVIGGPAVVSFEQLMSGTRICQPFELEFPNQSKSVAVSLKVGQKNKQEVSLTFRLEDSREKVSSQDQEQVPQGASSSQKQRTSHGSTGETPEKEDDEEVEPDGDGYYNQTMKQANPSQGQLDPKKNYEMDAVTKGRMFICNMRKDRIGSKVDVRNVKHVFKEIGYEMEIHSDLTAKDLKDKLRNFVDSSDHNDMSSVVFLLMGHGTKKGTGIICKLGDKDVVSTEFVMEQVSRMKSMDGKPKMVFFQCCRGTGKGEMVEIGQDATDKAIPAKSDVSKDDPTTDEDTGTEEETDDDESDLSIPADSDVFKVNATKHGNKAYRSRAKGTWFIHTLCKVLLENAHDSDLSTMLEQVTGDVGKMGSKEKAQVLEVVKQGVSRKMYFLPKYRPSKA